MEFSMLLSRASREADGDNTSSSDWALGPSAFLARGISLAFELGFENLSVSSRSTYFGRCYRVVGPCLEYTHAPGHMEQFMHFGFSREHFSCIRDQPWAGVGVGLAGDQPSLPDRHRTVQLSNWSIGGGIETAYCILCYPYHLLHWIRRIYR